MAHAHRYAGDRGEGIASSFLASRGCPVVSRNLRTGADEVDLVVDDRGKRVVVEVKYTSRAGVDPLEAVDHAKLGRLRRALRSIEPPVHRLDLIGISEVGGALEVRWLIAVTR